MWTRSRSSTVLGLGDDGYLTGDVHVYPMGDLREHEVGEGAGVSCWCHPKRDDEVEGVVVHNSMDERESYEQGRKPH